MYSRFTLFHEKQLERGQGHAVPRLFLLDKLVYMSRLRVRHKVMKGTSSVFGSWNYTWCLQHKYSHQLMPRGTVRRLVLAEARLSVVITGRAHKVGALSVALRDGTSNAFLFIHCHTTGRWINDIYIRIWWEKSLILEASWLSSRNSVSKFAWMEQEDYMVTAPEAVELINWRGSGRIWWICIEANL